MLNRKMVLIAAGALMTAGAVAAVSAPWERGHRGSITQDDYDSNTRARFARLDANGNGVIEGTEIEAALARRAGRHADKMERRGERLLRRFDADNDGKATREEFLQSVDRHFAQFDLNSDGRITDDDLPPAMRGRGVLTGDVEPRGRHFGRRILALLRGADADKDGIITREEVTAAAERRFAVLDRNQDGILDTADRDVLRKQTLDYRVARFAHRYGASDGSVTKDQFFAKAKERFARLDRDSDGTLSRDERPGRKHHRGWRHRGWHERGDGDHDRGSDVAPGRGDASPQGK